MAQALAVKALKVIVIGVQQNGRTIQDDMTTQSIVDQKNAQIRSVKQRLSKRMLYKMTLVFR